MTGFNVALTAVAIKALKPRDRLYTVTDGKSLVIKITPAGGKLWEFRFTYDGRQRTLSLGAFPLVTISAARAACDEARLLLNRGINPADEKQQRKKAAADATPVANTPTFCDVALKVIAKRRASKFSETTLAKDEWMLVEFGDVIRNTPMPDIVRSQISDRLRAFESVGHLDKLHRMRRFCSTVFDYAIDEGIIAVNPTPRPNSFATPQTTSHAAILDEARFGQFLRDCDNYRGIPSVVFMLRFSPHVFLRSHEIRDLQWSDVNWEDRVIRIPGSRMRKSFNRGEDGKDHLIPISKPVYAMLEEMLPWSGPGAGRTAESRIFPGQKTGRPISENTMNVVYRNMGYDADEIVFHGLRSTATTWLNEDGWKSDWIEMQMAHVERDSVRRAYNAAKYLKGRRKMMKAWSKKLEGIKAEAPN